MGGDVSAEKQLRMGQIARTPADRGPLSEREGGVTVAQLQKRAENSRAWARWNADRSCVGQGADQPTTMKKRTEDPRWFALAWD